MATHSLLQLKHCPLPTKNKFIFETIWASHATFPALVQQAWHEHSQLISAIEHFTEVIQEWNKSTFGNIFKRKK